MEKFQRSPAPPPPPPLNRRRQNNPSFSSSLLDAIYRSIDESDGDTPKRQFNPIDKPKTTPPPLAPPYHCRRRDSGDHRCLFSNSSSSDSSSFGGFSSDADSIPRPRPVNTRFDRIRSDPPPERKRHGSIRSRIRDLRTPRTTPGSPGTRFSAFLNAIFPGGGRNCKKPKFAGVDRESETSPSRSCVSKSTRSSSTCPKQRSVRFDPVSRDSGVVRDPRVMVEELLRRFGIDQEDEDSDCESVSSSDLFELDSLSAIGRFKDELPVYGTTSMSSDRGKAPRRVIV